SREGARRQGHRRRERRRRGPRACHRHRQGGQDPLVAQGRARSIGNVMTRLEVEVLPHGEGLPLPRYETDGAAGLDLRAAIDTAIVLAPMERRPIPTGLRVAIPRGFEGQVRARSGLALKHGIALVNAPGTIDSDYRGEVQVLLVNLGP